MPIRPANTVTLIKRRLDDAEHADRVDLMELVGLHDELARLERKWRMQIAEQSERRKPEADIEKLNGWFARLDRLLERTTREGATPADYIEKTRAAIAARPTS